MDHPIVRLRDHFTSDSSKNGKGLRHFKALASHRQPTIV